MSHAHTSYAPLSYQTDGSCALAPAPVPYLRLVEDAEVIPLRSHREQRHTTERTHEEPHEDQRRMFASGVVAIILAFALIFASLAYADSRAEQAFAEAVASTSFEVVTVHAGESIWSIASEHGVEGLSTAQVADVIRSENGLESSLVHPGDTIFVPVG